MPDVREADSKLVEAELLAPIPRDIPDVFWKHGKAAEYKRNAGWLVRIGAALMLLGSLKVVGDFAETFPFLDFAMFAGAIAFAIAGHVLYLLYGSKKPFQYFVNGKAVAVTINELALVPAQIYNGQVNAYKYVASCSVVNPTPAVSDSFQCESDMISTAEKERLMSAFRVGDTVTALYLKSDPARTMKLYGFLRLRPDIGIVRRTGYQPATVAQRVFEFAAVLLFIAGPIWCLYAMDRFDPVATSRSQWVVTIAGSILGSALLLGLIATENLRKRKERRQKNHAAFHRGEAIETGIENEGIFGSGGWTFNAILVLGAMLMSGMFTWTLASTLNSLLDKSPKKSVPVQIVDAEVSESILLRVHTASFKFDADEKTLRNAGLPASVRDSEHKLALPKSKLAKLHQTGIAEVRSGRFGWPWVDTIHPNVR